MLAFDVVEKHPNPQFFRKDYFDLCGSWGFCFDRKNAGLKECWQCNNALPEETKIQVPFVYQSEKSGIASDELCGIVWYKKSVRFPAAFSDKRIILHFAAVDYECDIWVNGLHAAHHEGGYSGFCADITELVCHGLNDLTVRVSDDDYAKENMRGKQLWGDGRFGCWYTRYTGIWQPVWAEAVSTVYIDNFIIRTDIDENRVSIKAKLAGVSARDKTQIQVQITVNDSQVAEAQYNISGNYMNEWISVDYPGSPFRGSEWWSPEHPVLYQMRLTVLRDGKTLDDVQTYFGMKKLEAADSKVLLNNFPFYHRSVLNQGYYPKGFITAEGDEQIISDIKLIKSLGFNAMRIHQKTESPKFLYWCDRLGIAVWEEMPSMYQYREEQAHNILGEITDIVSRDINHPSIFTWVMFNESWGVQQIRFDKQQQNFANGAYFAVKAMDPTRFVISNDGWQQVNTDIMSIHDYSEYGGELTERYMNAAPLPGDNPEAGQRRKAFAEGYSYNGQPVMITEYGGISYLSDGGWGYNGKVKSEEEFLARFESLTSAIKQIPYVTGYCFTQFTDVENEQNGLVTMDRRPKADAEKIRRINLA